MRRIFSISASTLLLTGTAMATPANEPAQIEEQQVLMEAIDTAFAELMKPGPKQVGWNRGGIDIDKLVEAAPGGLSGNYLLVVDKDGERSVTIIRAQDPDELIPKSWKPQIHVGTSTNAADAHSLTIAGVDGPFYLVGWENRRRVGDAYCSTGNIGGDLYEDLESTAKGELPRNIIPTLFHAMVAQLEKQDMCWRYDREGDGFKVTYFLADGRTLPRLSDSGDRVTIVRAAPVEQLLARPATGN